VRLPSVRAVRECHRPRILISARRPSLPRAREENAAGSPETKDYHFWRRGLFQQLAAPCVVDSFSVAYIAPFPFDSPPRSRRARSAWKVDCARLTSSRIDDARDNPRRYTSRHHQWHRKRNNQIECGTQQSLASGAITFSVCLFIVLFLRSELRRSVRRDLTRPLSQSRSQFDRSAQRATHTIHHTARTTHGCSRAPRVGVTPVVGAALVSAASIGPRDHSSSSSHLHRSCSDDDVAYGRD
jgi:hypothetical protein